MPFKNCHQAALSFGSYIHDIISLPRLLCGRLQAIGTAGEVETASAARGPPGAAESTCTATQVEPAGRRGWRRKTSLVLTPCECAIPKHRARRPLLNKVIGKCGGLKTNIRIGIWGEGGRNRNEWPNPSLIPICPVFLEARVGVSSGLTSHE